MAKSTSLTIVARSTMSSIEVEDGPDERLVDRAVSHIRTVLQKTVERGLDEIGQYLLKEFYGNDEETYWSHRPNKNASLSLLLQKCDSLELPMSRTSLGNALRVAAVTRSLPRDSSYRDLPVSHRIALARIEDPVQRERLAARAQSGKLSVAKLRPLIEKERGRSRSQRSPSAPLPPLIKVLERLGDALRDQETGRLPFKKSELLEMTGGHRERAEAAYVRLLPRLRELEKLMLG